MLYVKNLPIWERTARVVAACAMVACGVYISGRTEWVFFGLAAATLATAIIGFCPGCALVGRRPVSGGQG